MTTSAFQIIPQRYSPSQQSLTLLSKSCFPTLTPWSFTFNLNPFLKQQATSNIQKPGTEPKSFTPKLLSVDPKLLQQLSTETVAPPQSFSPTTLLSEKLSTLTEKLSVLPSTSAITSSALSSGSSPTTLYASPITYTPTSLTSPPQTLSSRLTSSVSPSVLNTHLPFPSKLADLLRQQPLAFDKLYKTVDIPEKSIDSIDIGTLVNLSIKDLNRQLRGMSRAEVVKLKQLRRRLKNRTYAKLSRHKRVATISMLEEEINELEQELSYHSKETERIQISTKDINQKLSLLLKFAQDRNIPLVGVS